MTNNSFMRAEDVAEVLGISKSHAYKIMRKLNDELAAKGFLSGLNKQDYLISRVLQREITVIGNPRVYKALKNELARVLTELQRIVVGDVSEELLETIELITFTLNGLKEDS